MLPRELSTSEVGKNKNKDSNLIKPINLLKESYKKDLNVPQELKREYTNVLEQAECEREPNVVEFLKKNEIDFYDYLKNRVTVEINKKKEHIDSLRVMTPLGLLSSLESYASNEKNNKDVAQWFHDQREALDNSSKKKPSSDWTQRDLTGDLDDNGSRKPPEVSRNQQHELPKEVSPTDSTDQPQAPAKKPESKFRKLMRNALKKIWDVMKRPIKFLARKTLDGIAFVPYNLVRLTAKGTWHEMRKHPGKFTAIMVGLNILCSVGIAPYLLWLARNQHQREKQAREGTQSPPETRSWPALAHALQSYEGRYHNRVNGWGDSMLRSYERLGGKDLNWEDPKKKKSDDSQDDSQKEEKSKHKKNSEADSEGGTGTPRDVSGDQAPPTLNSSENMTLSKPEGSPKEMTSSMLNSHKYTEKPKKKSWGSTLGNILRYGYNQPYNQSSPYSWQSSPYSWRSNHQLPKLQ